MAKVKKTKAKEAPKSNFETVDEEKFLEGNTETSVKLRKLKDGDKSGIAINTGTKHTDKYTDWRGGTWLPSTIDASSWIDKLKLALHILFGKWYGRKVIVSENDLEIQRRKLGALQQQLLQEASRMQEMQGDFLELQVKKELAKEAKSNRGEYATKLDAFEKEIINSSIKNLNAEEDVKRFIKENRWIMGLDCEVRAKNKDVDNQAEIDLHVITSFGQNKVVEAKSPNKKPFYRKKEGSRLTIAPELTEALSEIITYMRKTDFYSNLLEEGTQKIPKPSGIIVMGYELSKEEEQLLHDLNYHLAPHVRIITYKMLIENAKKEISLLDNA
jgi:hypothetical protein